MPFEPGLSYHWYLHGKVAAKSGKYSDMYAAWHARKSKPVAPGARVTAQESFYQGYMDVAQKTNPIPSKWTPARVRRIKGGKVQIALPVRRRK